MNIRAEIEQLIRDALQGLDIEYSDEIVIDYPQNISHGDFAVPIAMKLAKKLNKSPSDVADEILRSIYETTDGQFMLTDNGESDLTMLSSMLKGERGIEIIECCGGFINFTLAKQYWADLNEQIANEGDSWGQSDSLVGQTYLVEHSSPNMFKPFHVGHLVNNFVGASLNRIIVAAGSQTHVVSFPSDVSPGIAKAVWGLMDLGISENFTIEQVGDAYAHGSNQYKENDQVKQTIDRINIDLYNKTPGKEWGVYQRGLEMSYEYFVNITGRLGSSFESFFPESECEVAGKEIVRQHTGNVFIESDGAVIFEGSKYGLFDNVFINSAGFGTYLCKDIGLLSRKFETYDFDHSITVTDIEQKQHFQLVKKAAEQINADWSEKSQYIQHGRLALTSGKISSRDGGVPLAVDLLAEVKGRVLEKMRGRDIKEAETVAEQVAQSALKYAILKTAAGKNIVFDFEKDLAFEGNSGPYIQYAYVRAMSAVKQAEALLDDSDPVSVRVGKTPELERILVRFPDMVKKSLADYSPHHIANYIYELAQAFNSFYAQTKIAKADGDDLLVNIMLVRSVATTLQNGLHLLGIEAVEEM